MNDPNYIKAMEEGQDFNDDGIYVGNDSHTLTGLLTGLVSKSDHQACIGHHEDSMPDCYHRLSSGRSLSKNYMYGKLFGSSDTGLAGQLNCDVSKVKKINKNISKGLPKLPKLEKDLERVHNNRGYLRGLDGRKIFIRQEYMRLVYLLQTGEAVYMKVAWEYLDRYIKEAGLYAKTVIWAHDEFQYLIKEEHADEWCNLAKLAFEEAGKYLNLRCKMAGDPKIGSNWSETH